MHIKNIKLTNYRNYESLNLDLGKKTTVLIGKNGAGKTNLISALKQSLSFIFSKNSKISQYSFVAESGQKVQSFETTDSMRAMNPDGTQNQNGTWPIRIETTMDIGNDKPLHVVFERKNLSEGMKETYSTESIRFWERYKDLNNLPVLAFYSDAFPHEKVRIGKKIQDKLDSQFGISQSDAYYNWDDPRDCSNVWQQYFAMQWKNYKYGNVKNKEESYLSAVRDCLIKFAQPLECAEENKDFILNDITVTARGSKEIVVLRFKNGMEADFESLPAGYRRAFAMVFDLANRAFLLNGNCDPQGIAFIDEIDLHLHPSLAQEILERLQRTFVHLQLLASTHSPVVLSNYKQDEDNVLYQISTSNGEGLKPVYKKLENSYGVDYNSLLENQMEVPVRNSLLQELINAYNYWKNAGEGARMDRAMTSIIELVGENSIVVKDLKNSELHGIYR